MLISKILKCHVEWICWCLTTIIGVSIVQTLSVICHKLTYLCYFSGINCFDLPMVQLIFFFLECSWGSSFLQKNGEIDSLEQQPDLRNPLGWWSKGMIPQPSKKKNVYFQDRDSSNLLVLPLSWNGVDHIQSSYHDDIFWYFSHVSWLP